ncbi:MAG: hypothetical protein V1490_04230 [Candidatus Omnitrophota bacterium]|nr:hypothetical protein [Candidatus Omnitrophota bacterium]
MADWRENKVLIGVLAGACLLSIVFIIKGMLGSRMKREVPEGYEATGITPAEAVLRQQKGGVQ